MADERIQIIVEQRGVTEAIHNLQDLKNLLGQTDRQKVSISASVDAREALRGIEMISKGVVNAFDFSHDLSMKIGDTFSKMAGLFETNFTRVIEQKLVDVFSNLFTGNLQSSLNRADIMNTFLPYMELAGVSAGVAQEALNRVDLSIRGLPIGLDEAAQRLRRYQMFLGDTQYATDLTIGIQKAITAGGAPENFKTQAYYMIDRLLTAGNLSTSRQWYSLINGLGVSVRFLAEAMGVGSITSAELAAGLADGTYSAQQLLDALVALGNGTATSADDLDRALEIYKSTFQSWMENIKFASIRGGTNVINALDEVLEGETGKKITGYMENVRDGLNGAFSGVADWVRTNPETIIRVLDAFKGLISSLTSSGLGGIAGGILNNFARLIEYVTSLIDRLSGGTANEFIAFATTLAGPIGSFITKAGTSLPVILGVFQRFKDFDFETFIDKVMTQIKLFADVLERALRILPDGLLGDLMAFALVWGKPLATVIRTVGGAFESLSNIIQGFKMVLSFLAANPIVLGVGAILAAIGVIVGAISSAREKIQREHEEMQAIVRESLKTYDDYTAQVNQAAENTKSNIDASKENMEALREQSEETEALVAELLQLNDAEMTQVSDLDLMRDSLTGAADPLTRMQEIIAQLNTLYPDWNLALDESTGKLNDHSIAVLNDVDALMAAAELEAAQGALVTAYTNRYTLRARIRGQESNINQLRTEGQEYLDMLRERIEYARTHIYAAPAGTTLEDYRHQYAYGYVLPSGATLGETVLGYRDMVNEAEESLDLANKELEENDLLISSLNTVIGLDKEAAQAAQFVALSTEDLANGMDAATAAMLDNADATQQAKTAYEELRDAALDAIEAVVGGWGEFEPPEAMTAEELVGGNTARQEYLDSYGANLQKINDILSDPNNSFSPDIINFLNEVLAGGIDNAPEMAAVVEAFNNGTLGLMVQGWVDAELSKQQQADLEAATREKAKEIQDTINKELELIAHQEEALGKRNADDKAKRAAIQALFNGLGEERAQAILDWEEQNGGLEQVKNTAVATVQEASDEIGEALDNTLEKVSERKLQIREEAHNIQGDVKESLHNIGDDIRTQTDSNIVPAMNHMLDSLMHVSEDKGNEWLNFLRTLVSQAMFLFNNMTGVVTQANEVSGGTGSSGSGGSFSGAGDGSIAVHRARGGMVYAANGMFIPRGTDTVPAMLTPGEFVVNRRATQTIGAHILEQINRLDIPGALHSLMHRVPSTSGLSVVNNTNNSRDNHATVNQTFFNSGDDGYAYRRANRFVRALV